MDRRPYDGGISYSSDTEPVCTYDLVVRVRFSWLTSEPSIFLDVLYEEECTRLRKALTTAAKPGRRDPCPRR